MTLNVTCVESFYNDAEHYKNVMGKDSEYGTDFEIAMFAILYEVKVVLYIQENECYKVVGELVPPTENSNIQEHIMVLFSGSERSGHFDVLQYKHKTENRNKFERKNRNLRKSVEKKTVCTLGTGK